MKFQCWSYADYKRDRRERAKQKEQRELQRAYEEEQRLRAWHSWFAWKPVRLEGNVCVWLEQIQRKGCHYRDHWNTYGQKIPAHWEWEYKQ
jgi:hypothetical protein